MSKAAIFSSACLLVGIGVYNNQNDQSTEASQDQQEAVQFVGVDYSPEDTEFDKLVSRHFEYNKNENNVAPKKKFKETTGFLG